MISGCNLDLKKCGKYPCGVCFNGVGSNSIFCNGFKCWSHKKCSDKKGGLKIVFFKCAQCFQMCSVFSNVLIV